MRGGKTGAGEVAAQGGEVAAQGGELGSLGGFFGVEGGELGGEGGELRGLLGRFRGDDGRLVRGGELFAGRFGFGLDRSRGHGGRGTRGGPTVGWAGGEAAKTLAQLFRGEFAEQGIEFAALGPGVGG